MIWPFLLIWPLAISWAILQFLPQPPGWVHLIFDCIEIAIDGVLFWNLRQKFKQLPPERQAEFRQQFLDGFVKPKQIPFSRGWFKMVLAGLFGHPKRVIKSPWE